MCFSSGPTRKPKPHIGRRRTQMNADKNKQDGSFPEADEVYKAAAPRQSAARKRVSPRPAWLAERPEVRVRKDLAAFFEFFTPLHLCVAPPARRVGLQRAANPGKLKACARSRCCNRRLHAALHSRTSCRPYQLPARRRLCSFAEA